MIKNTPLANYYRPKKLDGFVGQKNIVSRDSWLYQAIKSDNISSMIFWGPPGVGKTTLAFIISQETKANFVELSATSSGVRELRKIVLEAQKARRLGEKTILFIDEIHRWNKSQQDSLLPYVEKGDIILIGATTENPSFAVNGALLSRLKVIVLDALSKEDVNLILSKAIKDLKIRINKDVINLITALSNGDARKALNILESAIESKKKIDSKLIKEIIAKPNLLYDKNGDEHYHLISALHKSMRGGDANAAIYYLTRMIKAGEDPLYIARRLIRFASEDIGLANNSALLLATATYDACRQIGLPECSVNLSHCVIYLSCSKKSILAYQSYLKAEEEVNRSGNVSVPIHLCNASTQLMKDLGYAKNYKYTPLEDDSGQEYLPKELKNKKFI